VRETFTQIYLHLVWATWDRLPSLSAEIRPAVYACIKAECLDLKAEVIAIGGRAGHVHVLVRIPATVAVASLVKQAKGASSHLVTHRLAPSNGFKWQGAYGAFSLSKSDVPSIRDYILRQDEHHRERTANPEYEFEPDE
jgi:REP element-mobilizing transposase RayT